MTRVFGLEPLSFFMILDQCFGLGFQARLEKMFFELRILLSKLGRSLLEIDWLMT